jgi:2-dehydropantoate 2-reductase
VSAPAVEKLDGVAPVDLVLFCVKSFDTEAAAATLAPALGPGTGVLSIQNGVDNEDTLVRILGPGRVLGGMAQVFATLDGPGVIRHVQLGRIVFGEMDGRPTPRAQAFLAACQRAGIPAELSADVARTLWEKYAFLTAHAGMTAVTRCPTGILRRLPQTRLMYRRLLEEMVTVAAAEGVALGEGYVEQSFKLLDGMAEAFASSLHFDLTQGKRLELEALQGHAVRLGERHGVPTPTLFAVYAALLPHRDGPAPRAG